MRQAAPRLSSVGRPVLVRVPPPPQALLQRGATAAAFDPNYSEMAIKCMGSCMRSVAWSPPPLERHSGLSQRVRALFRSYSAGGAALTQVSGRSPIIAMRPAGPASGHTVGAALWPSLGRAPLPYLKSLYADPSARLHATGSCGAWRGVVARCRGVDVRGGRGVESTDMRSRSPPPRAAVAAAHRRRASPSAAARLTLAVAACAEKTGPPLPVRRFVPPTSWAAKASSASASRGGCWRPRARRCARMRSGRLPHALNSVGRMGRARGLFGKPLVSVK